MQIRYQRQVQLPGWGEAAQARLKSSSVLVVGAGGLGVPVLQYLAAAGVGHIGIADGDVVELSNIHRQPLYDPDDTGRNKATVAAEKLFLLNGEVQTTVYSYHLTATNAGDIIRHYDLIIDASDNFPTRYLLNDACVLLDKPWIYGAVSAMEGQLAVLNFHSGPTYRCLFPTPPEPGAVPDCETSGILGTIPGTIGMLMATEALKILAGLPVVMQGTLLHWQATEQRFDKWTFRRDAEYKKHVPATLDALRQTDYPAFCGIRDETSVSADDLVVQDRTYLFLDVRNTDELPEPWFDHLRWSLDEIRSGINQPELQGDVLVYCQTGSRTPEAIRLLKQRYPDIHFVSLQGGIKAWQLAEMNKRYGRT
ncbi:MAG TPA: HesA/MoeB/ThiF family protein [Chitinophagales bacterium]|nr:HesA/MoeB/ThiF family protein [Chitinophagales bacterium]